MTSLTGSEIRDNCVYENFFTPAPINVGFFHIWHNQVLRPPPLFISAATEATNLKLLYNMCSGNSMPKQLFGPKLAGVWAREHSKNFGTPTYFYNR